MARAARELFYRRGLGGLGFPLGLFRLGDAFKDFIAVAALDHLATIPESLASAARAGFGIGCFHLGVVASFSLASASAKSALTSGRLRTLLLGKDDSLARLEGFEDAPEGSPPSPAAFPRTDPCCKSSNRPSMERVSVRPLVSCWFSWIAASSVTRTMKFAGAAIRFQPPQALDRKSVV